MISPNGHFHEQAKLVTGLAPFTPNSTTPDYVSLKNYYGMTVVLLADNATSVTPTAITLHQATDIDGTDVKTLAFTKAWVSITTADLDDMQQIAVTSDTYNMTGSGNANELHILEVSSSELDVAGGFDCVRVGTGDTVNAVVSVLYILWPSRYSKPDPPSAIID